MRFVYRSLALLSGFLLTSSGPLGCAHFGARPNELRPLRIADVEDEGDAARRASQRLVIEGLEADAAGDGSRAQARYQRALQVDVTNPYAYLAIARHHVEAHDSAHALQFLDRAEALLRMQDALSEEVQVDLDGLRGGALYDAGETDEAIELLDRARERSPEIWGDGALQPEELR